MVLKPAFSILTVIVSEETLPSHKATVKTVCPERSFLVKWVTLAVNFDFQCKCSAKSVTNNVNIPTDSNAAAQQQIQQLNEQIRRLQEQLRRQQQGASAFEQFGSFLSEFLLIPFLISAQMLSMADGLDCNCSGSSSPFSNLYQNTASSPGLQNMMFNQVMAQNRLAGLSGMPFAQRMAPTMIPQLQGPMFPMKS